MDGIWLHYSLTWNSIIEIINCHATLILTVHSSLDGKFNISAYSKLLICLVTFSKKIEKIPGKKKRSTK